jgi:hypothetical protein
MSGVGETAPSRAHCLLRRGRERNPHRRTTVSGGGSEVAFNGYELFLWLLVVGSLLAALSARLAHERYASLFGAQLPTS